MTAISVVHTVEPQQCVIRTKTGIEITIRPEDAERLELSVSVGNATLFLGAAIDRKLAYAIGKALIDFDRFAEEMP